MSADLEDWPFDAPRNQVCFVSKHVLNGDPIRHVYHDWDDGGWQFLPDRVTATEDCRLVCLETVCRLDPAVGELADMPEGWRAHRGSDGIWHRQQSHPYPTFASHGYHLIPVAVVPDVYPETPPESVRTSLQPGQLVKLVFRFSPEESTGRDYDVERMWVMVSRHDTELDCYQGILNNDPGFNSGVSSGDAVVFNQLHVLAIFNSP